jgi:predicted transposase YdaD
MFDTLSKFLADEYSQDLSSWLIGKPIKFTELKSKELSLEPIRADSVVLLKSRKLILHGEFQTDPDPEIGFREADYGLRIYRKFPNRRLVQVVIYLRQTNSPLVYETEFRANQLVNTFQVMNPIAKARGL